MGNDITLLVSSDFTRIYEEHTSAASIKRDLIDTDNMSISMAATVGGFDFFDDRWTIIDRQFFVSLELENTSNCSSRILRAN